MNRRDLLRGVLGVAGGLVLPPSVADVAAEVERRYWALGQMPGRDSLIIDMWEQDFIVSVDPGSMAFHTIIIDGSAYPVLRYVKVPTPQNGVSVRGKWVE